MRKAQEQMFEDLGSDKAKLHRGGEEMSAPPGRVVPVARELMILAGLTMSPGTDGAVPQLLTLFGGRQTGAG